MYSVSQAALLLGVHPTTIRYPRMSRRRGETLIDSRKNAATTIRVCRPSRWGNPFKLTDHSREESMSLYKEYLEEKLRDNQDFLKPLEGMNLACFCDLELECHIDILLKYVEDS